MASQKTPYEGHDLVGVVLEDVVPAVGEAVDLGVGEHLHPLGEKVVVEDEVLVAPANEDRLVGEPRQVPLDLGDQVEPAVARLQRGESVLDAALGAGLSGPGRLHDLLLTTEATVAEKPEKDAGGMPGGMPGGA